MPAKPGQLPQANPGARFIFHCPDGCGNEVRGLTRDSILCRSDSNPNLWWVTGDCDQCGPVSYEMDMRTRRGRKELEQFNEAETPFHHSLTADIEFGDVA